MENKTTTGFFGESPLIAMLQPYLAMLKPLVFLIYMLILGLPPLALHLLLHPLTYLPSRKHPLRTQLAALRSKFFALSWSGLSPMLDPQDAPLKGPLLARAYGTVLEIGPGVGDNIKYYTRSAVARLILVEPNVNMHMELRARAAAAGYNDKDGSLLLLGCGGAAADEHALAAAGITEGSIDTVAAIHVLCGIPGPARAVELYRRLLRRGGQLLFFEHVRSAEPVIARAQALYTRIVWQQVADGCCLDRPTGAWIVAGQDAAGEDGALVTGVELANGDKSAVVRKRWAHLQIAQPKDQPRYSAVPHIIGWAVKG